MARTLTRRKTYSFPENLKKELLHLSNNGLVVDFSNTIKNKNYIRIPINVTGNFSDMDDIYNCSKSHIGCANYSAILVHKNKGWVINYI